MRRHLPLALLLVVLAAAPAAAKGVDGVVLTAGDQEVAIEWSYTYGTPGDLESLVRSTHLYDVDWLQGDRHVRPTGDLGPAVIASWHFPDPVGSVIVQHLYPFAEGGPVGHVPGGQTYFDGETTDTWHPLRRDIVDVLEAAGIDTTRLGGPDRGVLFGGILLALSAIIAGRLRQVA